MNPKALVAELREDAAYNRDVAELTDRFVSDWQRDLLDSAVVADKAADAVEQLHAEYRSTQQSLEAMHARAERAEFALAATTAELKGLETSAYTVREGTRDYHGQLMKYGRYAAPTKAKGAT